MNINKYVAAAVLVASAAALWAQATPTAAPAAATAPSAFKTDKERMAYALGLQLGPRLKGIDIDYAALSAGIKDSAAGNKPLMTDQEIETSLNALQKMMMAAADAENSAAGAKNQKAGDDFLAANGKKDGIKTTASGLEYKVIKSGTGKSPKSSDTVSVNYKGSLISGKEFDASGAEPVSFPVDHVIPGWTEALQLMKEGDKWQLFIPAKLAYGERGAGQDIGPNEVLIFEVELLQVK